MAIINPNIEIVKSLRQKPTEGELTLLNFLQNNLDDSFEVFFQPFLNGDMPDIIMLRKNAGAYIFEVKDWDLYFYRLTDKNNWQVKTIKNKWQDIQSPIQQVYNYKINLYNLHIEGLLEKRIKNVKYLSIVNCAVYFHKVTTKKINSFVEGNKTKNYLKFLQYFDIIGYDSLNKSTIFQLLDKREMTKTSSLMDDELYRSFKRHLQPPIHILEQGIPITYSSEQKQIIESQENSKKKYRGVAGSGKTVCLAKRAVNANKRHNNCVLIICYNMALKNYIHDKLNEIRENFAWDNFRIMHYHLFFKSMANNYNLSLKNTDDWDDEKFFEPTKENIVKYDTIIIDEIQDFEKSWVNIILKYFLKENGEYVVFGDEKQNIYQRSYEQAEKKPYTGIGGAWNKLKCSYRITNDISRLAKKFQNAFFSNKYEIDEIEIQKSLLEKSELRYYVLENININWIIKCYTNFAAEFNLHPNDICIQAAEVETLREIDYVIRTSSSQKTNTMFETKEIYNKLADECKENKSFTKKIDEVRRNKKFNFWPNRGLLKMSTIHSLKGWEVDTIFLLITPEKSMYAEFVNAELIYTAITRCRTNLVVININNAKFHDFFNTAIPQFEQRNKMVQELLKKAKAGDANAQSIVGQMYYVDRSNYLGIANVDCWPQDYAKAAYWLQKAAEQGEAEAQVFLGEMYKNGDGVPQDNAKAAYWIQKSAEQGCIYGQLVLSVLYDEGKGVPQDHTKADYWFHRAAEQDDVIAESLLEPQHFNQARQEFNDGVIDQTLWTEVLITATGNEDSLKAAYIKLRAKELFWNQAEQKLNDGTVDHDLDGQEHP